MKIETFIKRYAEKNKTPDQKYCPDLIIYWHGKNKNGYYTKNYDPKTGVIKSVTKFYGRDKCYLSARSYGLNGVYAKEIGNGIMEIAFVAFDNMKRGKDGEKREWRYKNYYGYFDRIFVDKDFNAYGTDGKPFAPSYDGKYYNKKVVNGLHQMGLVAITVTPNIMKVWENFTGEDLKYGWETERFYKRKRNISRASRNALLDVELSELDVNKRPVTFQIINDNLAVFRLVHGSIKANRYEDARVFIDGKGKVTIIENAMGSWRVTSVPEIYGWSYKREHFDSYDKPDLITEMKKFEPLKYIADISYDPKEDVAIVNNVIMFLRHPMIELAIKAGYTKISKYLKKGRNIRANAKTLFGVDIKKEKGSLTKMFDVSKHVLNAIEKEFLNVDYGWNDRVYMPKNALPLMRAYFGEQLKDLTYEDIVAYWNVFGEVAKRWLNPLYVIDPTYDGTPYLYRESERRDAINGIRTEFTEKLIPKLKKLGAQETSLYIDAVTSYRNLIDKPEIDFLDFKTADDVALLHNNIVNLLNTERAMAREQRDEALRETFKKKQKNRIEKFESVGDKYEIVVPKQLSEITTEGQTLSHCVGGYLERHARGETNIIFLRNKSFPTIPFYTIEVDNSGYVVQIHGKHNRWLGNDPDAIAFVNSWIKERELKCEEYKLLDTAEGYGRSGKEVDRSYLVA